MTRLRASLASVDALAIFTRPFSGHPLRIGAALVAAALALPAAWYLGSPLLIRTVADDALTGVTATLARGSLGDVDTLHRGQGAVLIVEAGGARFVRFDSIAITNGPDLYVYLSPDTRERFTTSTALYLGPLKATDGSFHYELPAGTDVSAYRSVVVWCRAFSVLFTWADLTR